MQSERTRCWIRVMAFSIRQLVWGTTTCCIFSWPRVYLYCCLVSMCVCLQAVEVAELTDRLHLKNTYCNLAKHSESVGEIRSTIKSYEQSGTHRFEVVRMLINEPEDLSEYNLKTQDKEAQHFWSENLECIGDQDSAIDQCRACGDYRSVARLLTFMGDTEEAIKVVEETKDKAASAYYVARVFAQLEDWYRIKKAVCFYTMAKCYSHAITITKDFGMEAELMNLALLSTTEDKIDAAKYFETKSDSKENAIFLYHRAGELSVETVRRVAEYFIQQEQFEKAVQMLLQSHELSEALEMCLQYNVIINEEVTEKLTPSPTENETVEETSERVRQLDALADGLVSQGSYHLAAIKYTQASNKLQAMKALLKSSDTERVVFFASVSRQKEIYIMAANYLQSLDWRSNPTIIKNIISFYTKGRALEMLSNFYDTCAKVEMEEYQNYEKALGALNKALLVLEKSKETFLKRRLELITKFIDIRSSYPDNPDQSIDECLLLLNDPHIDTSLRTGDLYAMIITHYAYHGDHQQDEDTIDTDVALANDSFKKQALDKPVSSYEAYCNIICQSSEESDEAPSPKRINTDAPVVQIDEGVAKVLLQEHQELICVLDPGPALSTATIRRNHIFSDVISQFKPVAFDPIYPFVVKFADEPGMDSGGPKRELFRLFKHSLQQQPHLFSSTDVGLVPMHNVQAVINGDFEAVGKVLADTELDRVVSEIKADHPFIGEVMIAGNLRSRHIQVTRSRIRASIHRLDPFVHDNMKCAIRRRTYHVQSPNYIWHIDGNHKLIRWRIVVHGGIDGYSRVIVFLKPSTNNLAATMLSHFEVGVTDYGVPTRIRTDRGGENVAVWQYMMRQHNNITSVIVGSSTHNECIERLWGDVHRCVLKPFADQFRHLETIGLLDPLNEVDIYCLHVCYLPRIEKCLNSFQEAWNNHCLSTEGNATPLQLFLTGLLLTSNDPAFIPTPPTNNCSGLPTSLDHVTVPRSRFMPCHLLCQELQERAYLLLAIIILMMECTCLLYSMLVNTHPVAIHAQFK